MTTKVHKSLFPDGGTSRESIRALETRLSFGALIFATTAASGNLAGRIAVFGDSFLVAAIHQSVWLTLSMGIALFLAGMAHHRIGRVMQAAVMYFLSCLTALGSAGGDFTSLVYFGLALLIASQYELLSPLRLVKLVTSMVIYGAFLFVGIYSQARSASLGATLNIVAAGFIAYLFVVIASLRLREMADRQAELGRLVAERTKDLQEEVDRRGLAEEEAKESAEKNRILAGDREVLLRELHHRSKNDLQMILSLLSLRADKGDRPELVELFRPTQDRIRAIALVHEQLDNSARFDAISLRDYLEHLLSYLQVSHQEYPVAVQPEIDAEVSIKLESATHIGLLVHELVLCSYRYSLEPGKQGTISVSATARDGRLTITIKDSGRGLPEEIDPAAPDQDEIAIVAGLVKRLSCELSLDKAPEPCWTAHIPLAGIQQPAAVSPQSPQSADSAQSA